MPDLPVTEPMAAINPEVLDTPIYDAMVTEFGDVLDQGEDLRTASQLYEEAREALRQVVQNAYLEKIDEEARREHRLV